MSDDKSFEAKIEGDKLVEPEKVEKTEKEIKAEEFKKAQEELEEKTVVIARDKLMPLLKDANLGVEETKIVLQVLENTITQGVYALMNKNTVESMDIISGMNSEFPNADIYKNILLALKDETMGFGVGVLHWLNGKIDKDTKDLYLGKTFNEIVKDF